MIYQLIKFAFVGASGVIVDFLSTWIIREKIKLNSYIANSIGFCFAATSNYVLNRVWTFASDNPDVQGEYIKFMIISTLGLAINNSVIFALSKPWADRILPSSTLRFYISKLFATGVVTFWNFFMNYFFTFAN
ncbi:MAG: GtrA family protein [Bacteroidales bacterium]